MMHKALFLDRDGTVNVEKNYVFRISDFEFREGIFDLCRGYSNQGYLIFIITNQAGIARGYYSEDDFLKLTEWMTDEFKKHGITITKVYYCPHHPDINGPCDCRKPNPAMILRAATEFDIDLEESVLYGDKESDLLAGLNAGMRKENLFLVNPDK